MLDDVSWECELTLGCGEVWEYLYHNHTRINYITNPVSVTPVCCPFPFCSPPIFLFEI